MLSVIGLLEKRDLRFRTIRAIRAKAVREKRALTDPERVEIASYEGEIDRLTIYANVRALQSA